MSQTSEKIARQRSERRISVRYSRGRPHLEAELRGMPTDCTGSDFMVEVIKTLGIPYVCADL